MQVLLVAEQERLRTAVEPLLLAALPVAKLTWVSQCAQASALAQQLSPAVILIDDDLLYDDPIRLIRQLAQEVPQALILALVEEANLVEARQSVLAGARAVVTKPVAADDLQAKLAHIATPLPAPSPDPSPTAAPAPAAPWPPAGQVVAFVAAKGGVGRTTLLVNTGVSLHELTGQSVLLVDAHFGAPTLDMALNLLAGPTWHDCLAALDQAGENGADDTLPDTLFTVHATGLRVLPAPVPATDSAQPTPTQTHRLLNAVRRRFDWILIDLGDPYAAPAAALMDVADRILLTVLPELTGLRNARALLANLAPREYPPGKLWLILNRAGMRGGVSRTDIEERLQLRVRHALPDDQPPATFSLNRGVPLVVSHPQGALSRSLVELAQHLAVDLAVAEPAQLAPPPRRNAVSRWVGRLWGP